MENPFYAPAQQNSSFWSSLLLCTLMKLNSCFHFIHRCHVARSLSFHLIRRYKNHDNEMKVIKEINMTMFWLTEWLHERFSARIFCGYKRIAAKRSHRRRRCHEKWMLITNIDIKACVCVDVGIHFYSYSTYYVRIVTVATKPFSFSESDSSACVCVVWQMRSPQCWLWKDTEYGLSNVNAYTLSQFWLAHTVESC